MLTIYKSLTIVHNRDAVYNVKWKFKGRWWLSRRRCAIIAIIAIHRCNQRERRGRAGNILPETIFLSARLEFVRSTSTTGSVIHFYYMSPRALCLSAHDRVCLWRLAIVIGGMVGTIYKSSEHDRRQLFNRRDVVEYRLCFGFGFGFVAVLCARILVRVVHASIVAT